MSATPFLTIGMPTYDDYDGVYFTIQTLRLMFDDLMPLVQFVVVDNHHDSPQGMATEKFVNHYVPNGKYVQFNESSGTAIAKNKVFEHADAPFVLCIDCHVLLPQLTLHKLMAWFKDNENENALVQGPLWYDALDGTISTHFDPVWRDEMYGIWGTDPRGIELDQEPFEIPMQGGGLFAMKKEFWPGFNPLFRGFGGEEGYIQEKVRQQGGRCLCLPFLRWVHRFDRPAGAPYKITREDKLRNYLLGYIELGLPIDDVFEHFRDKLAPRVIEHTAAMSLSELLTNKIVPQGTIVKRLKRAIREDTTPKPRTKHHESIGLVPAAYV